jgi:poly(A) polymerase
MKQHATNIVRELRNRGFQAYFAGGCVRDTLLGVEPADYDVATDATPPQVMRIFPETYAVGAQFGVVLVPMKSPTQVEEGAQPRDENPHPSKGSLDEAPSGFSIPLIRKPRMSGAPGLDGAPALPSEHPNYVEVATFRNDGTYSDGRHPDQVSYAKDPQEDVQRRDFTINGLLMDPLDGNRVLDFVGGREDLRAGVIRAIGDPERRFSEDKLRMLRAVRFAARLDYIIDPATFAAIQRLAPQIHQVSAERVRDELTKMLTEGSARTAFEMLDSTGVLKEVLPEVDRMHGVEQPPQFHPEGDVWIHTLLLLEKLPPRCSRTLAWGTLLHDVGKPPTFRVAPDRIRFDGHVEVGVRMAEEICRRLHFSNEDTRQIAALVANHMRFADAERMKESTLKRFLRLPRFDEHLELHRMDCLSSYGDLSLYNFVRERLQQTPPEEIRPQPLLTGEDLIALGHQPGPQFRDMLAAIEDAQLEGTLKSREEALEFVRREFPRGD